MGFAGLGLRSGAAVAHRLGAVDMDSVGLRSAGGPRPAQGAAQWVRQLGAVDMGSVGFRWAEGVVQLGHQLGAVGMGSVVTVGSHRTERPGPLEQASRTLVRGSRTPGPGSPSRRLGRRLVVADNCHTIGVHPLAVEVVAEFEPGLVVDSCYTFVVGAQVRPLVAGSGLAPAGLGLEWGAAVALDIRSPLDAIHRSSCLGAVVGAAAVDRG